VALNILLLGPQGAGKGTQAKRISNEYGIPHIASGEILRAEMAAATELGRRVKDVYDRGDLVSDDLMIELIKERLSHPDTDGGFVLDGFPRTTVQAEALDQILSEIGRTFTVVFALQIPDQVAFERLRRRAEIEGRRDDTDEAIRRRLDNYHRQTAPLIEYYRTRGNLVPIHGDRSENEVFAEIQRALEQVPAAERPVRDSGPVEGVWGNREVPPARTGPTR
jgi:adenylate kinase